MSKLGNILIDVHSQNNNLSLLDNNFKYMILDSLANNEKLVLDYKKKSKDDVSKDIFEQIIKRCLKK